MGRAGGSHRGGRPPENVMQNPLHWLTSPSGCRKPLPAAGRLLLAVLLAALPGCVSLETAAPVVGPPGSGPLAEGRALYVGRCAKCHAVEPVLDYSAAEWATIMPDMAERTKLSPRETDAVTAYVASVLQSAVR